MKKNKLNLKDLEISSFTEILSTEEKKKISGGAGPTPAGTVYTGITACCNPPEPKDTTTTLPTDTIN